MNEPAELAAQARADGRLGLDTEFMGEGRYRALLCLVQVVVGERIVLLDPLAGFDHSPLADVLADPEVEVVLHAGRQDIAILRRAWATEVRNVFDTQVAAGFAGLGAQTGYEGLLAGTLGVRLSKSASFTRWDQRPLSPEQLEYAREDVLHLLPLASALRERLEADGRLDWAREEFVPLEQVSEGREPEDAWRRLPRVDRLRPRARAVARELAAWRESTAQEEDRPPGSLLSDASLIEVARRQPDQIAGLDQIRGLHRGISRRRGDQIIEASKRGRNAPPLPAEAQPDRVPTEPSDLPLISLAEALVRARAKQEGVAYELVAARADLAQIVAAARRGEPEPPVRTLHGWRRALVGELLLELLAGRRALAVDDRRRVIARPV